MPAVIPVLLGGAGAALLAAAALLPRPRVARTAVAVRLPGSVGAPLLVRLTRAGVPVTPLAAVLLTLGAAVGTVTLAWLVRGSLVLAVVGLVSPPVAGLMAVTARAARYPDRVAAQLPPVIRATADGLSAGRSLRHALMRAAAEAPAPAAGELEVLVNQLELGARLDDALQDLCVRCPRPAVELMCGAILVSGTSGGNLARVLGELSARLEARRCLERELRGLGEQARMTAWLVGLLPALGAVVVEMAAPGLLARTLLHGPGLVSLVLSAALLGAAVSLVRRIGRAG